MPDPTQAAVVEYLVQSRDAAQRAIDDPRFAEVLARIADLVADALGAGGKLLLVGNGGSAADAQHIAGELVGRLNHDRAPLAAVALTADAAILTGTGNDYGYDMVFARQVLALARPGDVLLALSTSGRSPNVLRAIEAARELGIAVVGFSGEGGGDMAARCELCLQAPSRSTQLVQQLHMAAAHGLCAIVEKRLRPAPA